MCLESAFLLECQLNSLTTDELVPLLEGCNFNANIVASFLSNGITGADLAFINDATELLVLGKWWLGPSGSCSASNTYF